MINAREKWVANAPQTSVCKYNQNTALHSIIWQVINSRLAEFRQVLQTLFPRGVSLKLKHGNLLQFVLKTEDVVSLEIMGKLICESMAALTSICFPESVMTIRRLNSPFKMRQIQMHLGASVWFRIPTPDKWKPKWYFVVSWNQCQPITASISCICGRAYTWVGATKLSWRKTNYFRVFCSWFVISTLLCEFSTSESTFHLLFNHFENQEQRTLRFFLRPLKCMCATRERWASHTFSICRFFYLWCFRFRYWSLWSKAHLPIAQTCLHVVCISPPNMWIDVLHHQRHSWSTWPLHTLYKTTAAN